VKFSKISKTRLVDKVVEDLYFKISDGTLLPGDKLPGEIALSESLGVGRPTIREAIGQLIGLGLLHRGRYGVFVAQAPSPTVKAKLAPMLLENWEIRKLYEARMVVEGEIAVLACLRATPRHLEKLRELNQLMLEQSDDANHYWELDDQFHQLVAQMSDNTILLTMHQSIRDLFRKYEMSVNTLESIRKQTYVWHTSLIEAFTRKDTEAVRRVVHQSLSASEDALTALQKNNAELNQTPIFKIEEHA
jgi:GntR family transcriptional repressor for pyruvate dehydrogenase complex